jgi:hypothetical protein
VIAETIRIAAVAQTIVYAVVVKYIGTTATITSCIKKYNII